MEKKLNKLYLECIQELKSIGIDVTDKRIGDIEITISKRNNKRYGACKQEDPDKKTRFIEKHPRYKMITYGIYRKHYIEISPWVMELDDSIIKNTIIHELIHCMPYCNSHGYAFKEHAERINDKLGYNISRVRK